MTDQEREELVALIDEEIDKVTQEIVDLEELTQPIAPDSSLGRLTRMDAIGSKSVNEGTLRAARVRLEKLKDARARSSRSDFGLCRHCRQPIPPMRLLLIPESTTCVNCVGRG